MQSVVVSATRVRPNPEEGPDSLSRNKIQKAEISASNSTFVMIFVHEHVTHVLLQEHLAVVDHAIAKGRRRARGECNASHALDHACKMRAKQEITS